jgi:hypothetical protein
LLLSDIRLHVACAYNLYNDVVTYTLTSVMPSFSCYAVLPHSHPHRGFQTVTYVMEGSMTHRDNFGVKQIYNSGRYALPTSYGIRIASQY